MIVGVGGTFIYSKDPEALADWYARALGIETARFPGAPLFCEFPVREAEGEHRLTRCVWAIFPSDDEHPASPKSYRINYRVDDMDAMLRHLGEAGIVPTKTETNEYGKFTWLDDPEGREIELFEDTQMADAAPESGA